MKFRLFGTKIFISFPFCALLCLMLLLDRTGLALYTLIAVALHEAAHLFAMYISDCAPVSVRLIPASVQIVRKPFVPDKKTVGIALSGPAANLCVGLTALLNNALYGNEKVFLFAVINMALGIFNLLPVCGLDGGTVFKLLLSKKIPPYKAETALRMITALFGAAALMAGIYFYTKKTVNLSFFITALYFLICAAMGK